MRDVSGTPFFSKKSHVAAAAVFYTFLWGSAFPLVKLCMAEFGLTGGGEASKCLLAGVRFLTSGLLILCFCGGKARTVNSGNTPALFGGKAREPFDKKAREPLSGRSRAKIVCYGVLSTALQYAFTYIGLSRLTGAVGAVYDQCGVFLTVIAGGLFLRDDTLNGRKLIGCLLGFAGVLCVSLEPGEGAGLLSFSMGGEGMMLCASLCFAASYLLAKATADEIPAALLVGYGQLTGGALLTAGAFLCGGRLAVWTVGGVLTFLALAVISAAAYVLSMLPLRYFPASETASFQLLIPVFGAALSALMLGEPIFQWKYPVSLLLIGAGILLINRVSGKKKTEKNE